MKRHLFILALLLIVAAPAWAQKKYSAYAIGFYNQENLFDTCHDAGKNDFEYLPANGWNNLKYSHKLRNMARALADMGTDVMPSTVGCAAIGLAEVENDNVLNDLIAQKPLADRGYKYVHIEGPDKRGIDCALLYNPQLVTIRNQKLVPYVMEQAKDSDYFTRGFLTVSTTIAQEHVTFIVCHLPSRFNGEEYRSAGARQVTALRDSLRRDDPEVKILVMGDMNDDPTNESMHRYMRGKANISEVTDESDMYNPFYNTLAKQGQGTLSYRGSWNLFDQIMLSKTLLNTDGRKDFSSLKYWKHQIFRRDYLIQQEGQYKGTPLRTKASGRWLDGYSDHLPVVIYLLKEK